MDAFKILDIKKSVYEGNDRRAEALRAELKRDGIFLLNLMSSPGSGKTTTVLRTIETLKDEMRIGVLEADIEYVGLSCADGVVKRVEACLLDVLFGAISHADRSVAALHGPVLRRVSAAYPADPNRS